MEDHEPMVQLPEFSLTSFDNLDKIIEIFSNFFDESSNKIIIDWIKKIQNNFASYKDQPTNKLQSNALQNIHAFMEFLKGNHKPTSDFVDRITYLRSSQDFPFYDVINAVIIGLTTIQRELYFKCVNNCPHDLLFEMQELLRVWFETSIGLYARRYSQLQKNTLKVQKEELSQFAHILAHDLRNYLYSIGGYLILYKEKDPVTEKIKGILVQIDELLETSIVLAEAGEIINEKKLVDIQEVVGSIAEIVIPKSVKFSPYDLPKIYCDNVRISQVFKNIFENAILHGKASIIETYAVGDPGKVTIFVSNNGEKFPDSMFYTIENNNDSFKPKRKGLGLQIIKKILKAHNWKISLTNDPEPTIIIRTF